MSTDFLNAARKELAKLNKEIRDIEAQLADRRQDAKLVEQFIAAHQKRGGRNAAPKNTGSSSPRKRRKRGGKTIPEAIIDVVASATGPVSTGGIIDGLKALGIRAADTSVYSSINRMKDEGVLKSRPHKGRGNAYELSPRGRESGGTKKQTPAAKKKPKAAPKKGKGGKKSTKAGKSGADVKIAPPAK